MQPSRRWDRFLGLVVFGIVALSCSRTGLWTPEPSGGGNANCCRTPTPFGPIQIARTPDQVPIELAHCGLHGDEITAIEIQGTIEGCASDLNDDASLVFSDLTISFTTDGSRCNGQGVRTIPVVLTNVHYTAHHRFAPPCVSTSLVAPGYQIGRIDDSAYHTWFATSGGEVLRPILDNLVLRWISSPPGTCPPSSGFGTSPGNTSRCP
jgi:hypothetical protein